MCKKAVLKFAGIKHPYPLNYLVSASLVNTAHHQDQDLNFEQYKTFFHDNVATNNLPAIIAHLDAQQHKAESWLTNIFTTTALVLSLVSLLLNFAGKEYISKFIVPLLLILLLTCYLLIMIIFSTQRTQQFNEQYSLCQHAAEFELERCSKESNAIVNQKLIVCRKYNRHVKREK